MAAAGVAAWEAVAVRRRTRSKLAVVERRGPPRSRAATWAEWLCLSAASPQNVTATTGDVRQR